MDIVFILSVLLIITILIYSDNINSTSMIVTLAISYLISTIFGHIKNDNKFTYNRKLISASIVETWKYSKWTITGLIVGIMQKHGYVFIVSALLGLEEMADLSASRLLLMPLNILIVSSGRIIISKGVGIYAEGGERNFNKYIILIISILSIIWLFYIISVYLLKDYIIQIYGDKYSSVVKYILYWGIFFLSFLIRHTIMNSLVVCKRFKSITQCEIFGCLITLISCLVLIHYYDGYGAVLSLTIGEICLVLLLVSKLRNV